MVKFLWELSGLVWELVELFGELFGLFGELFELFGLSSLTGSGPFRPTFHNQKPTDWRFWVLFWHFFAVF